MALTQRQLEYVDYRLKSGPDYREADCLYLFPEHPKFNEDPEVRAELSRLRLELNAEELDLKRKRIAKEMLELEKILDLYPKLFACMESILSDPENKNAAMIIKMLLSSKIKYLEKFGENQANQDLPSSDIKSSGFEPFDKSKRAYDPDDWE